MQDLGRFAMTTAANSDLPGQPVRQDQAGAPSRPAWRLVGLAFGLYILAQVASAVFVFFVALGVAAAGASAKAPDAKVLFYCFGGLGTASVFYLGALAQGPIVGGGNLRAGLGDAPISRPVMMIVLGVAVAGYGTLGALAIYRTHPDIIQSWFSLSPWSWILVAVVVIVVGPIAEELFFRGWLWTGLRSRWGALPTAALTGALWLAIHLEQGVGKPVLLLPVAVFLSAARHFGRSVRASIALHMLNNLTGELSPIVLWKAEII